jgi:phosphatidylethanolamine/phosphatidyl-N-methylethanolamine N-methyltransferase
MINRNAWNRVRYSLYAPIYDPVANLLRQGRRRSIDLVAPSPGEHVLIVGCGTGLDLALLPAGLHITAGDIAPAMVRRAQARARDLGVEADIRVMDAHDLELADGSFDVVILHLVLAVVADPAAAMLEASRVLKPGGRVAIFDKFLPASRRPSIRRRLVNAVSRVFATDINRSLEPLLERAELRPIADESSLLGGFFRITVAEKRR